MKRLLTYLAIPAAVFLLAPALAGASYLRHPGPWAGFVCAFLTLSSQPPLSPADLVTDPNDRRSALLIFLAVVIANLASVLQFAARDVVTPAPASATVAGGIAIAALGMGLRLVAIRTLGRFFTSAVVVQDDQRVLSHGPYRWMRHPSYTGSILTVTGTAIALGSVLGLGLVGAAVVPAYLYRIRVEERTMLAGLGEEYARYRARTPALLPAWR